MKRADTTITLPSGVSAHSIAGPVDVAQQLHAENALDEAAAVLTAAGSALWDTAYSEVAAFAEDFLRFDVASAVLACWCTSEELIAAGAATRGTGAVELPRLVERNMRLAKHPAVELVLLRKRIATLTFDVTVDVHADVLTGTVRDGNLVALTGGPCTVTVTLSLGRKELAKGSRTIDRHLAVGLGSGLPLAAIPGQRGLASGHRHRRQAPA
jgi:hypothetical protein